MKALNKHRPKERGRLVFWGVKHPFQHTLRASFLRALRVWRRQQWRKGARGAKHGGDGGRRHGGVLEGVFFGGAFAP